MHLHTEKFFIIVHHVSYQDDPPRWGLIEVKDDSIETSAGSGNHRRAMKKYKRQEKQIYNAAGVVVVASCAGVGLISDQKPTPPPWSLPSTIPNPSSYPPPTPPPPSSDKHARVSSNTSSSNFCLPQMQSATSGDHYVRLISSSQPSHVSSQPSHVSSQPSHASFSITDIPWNKRNVSIMNDYAFCQLLVWTWYPMWHLWQHRIKYRLKAFSIWKSKSDECRK